MQFNPEQILTKFEIAGKEAIKKIFYEWNQQHQQNLDRLITILDYLKIDLVQNDTWKNEPDKLWAGIEPTLIKLKHWIKSIHVIPQNLSQNTPHNSFQGQFEAITEELPEEIRILIGDVHWQANKSDGALLKARKRLQPIKYRFIRQKYKVWNSMRTLGQKPPHKHRGFERKISLHQFIKMYLLVPLRQFLQNEWQEYTQIILGQLFIIQDKLTDLFTQTLLVDELGNILNKKNGNIFNTLYGMAEILKDIDLALSAHDNFIRQLDARIDNFWRTQSSEFSAAWEQAGTFQLPTRKYSEEVILDKEYKLELRLKKELLLWDQQVAGLIGEWQKDCELTQLCLQYNLTTYKNVSDLKTNLQDQIYPAFKSLSTETNRFLDTIMNLESFKDLKKLNQQKLNDFAQNRFSELLDTVTDTGLSPFIDTTLSSLDTQITDLVKNVVIFWYRDTENIPPRSKIRIIPLAELVSDFVQREYRNNMLDLATYISIQQDDIYRSISQLGRRVEFNFDSAMQLKNSDTSVDQIEEAKLIITDILKKILETTGTILIELDQLFARLFDTIADNSISLNRNISSMLVREHIFNSYAAYTKTLGRKKKKDLVKNIVHTFSDFIPALVGSISRKLQKIWRRYFSLRTSLTKSDTQPVLSDEISHFLAETEEKIAKLPYIYQKLFKFEPLSDDRFYSARTREIQILSDEYHAWQSGKTTSVVLIGELGSGRTTLLNLAKRDLFLDSAVQTVDIDQTALSEQQLCAHFVQQLKTKKITSFHELGTCINNRFNSHVFILENLNNLFEKTVNGLELLERFLNVILQTQKNVFWVITCSSYSWQYLRKTVSIEKYFRQVITLGAFSNGDIRTIILNRHRLSGYNIYFESNGVLPKKTKKTQSEDVHQKELQNSFFHKLNQISAGNIFVAMLFWLRSIRKISSEGVILSPSIEFNNAFLTNLASNELFTLAAIVNYEKISTEDHANLFNQSVEQSRLHLNQMYRHGLVVKDESYYQIHPFLYRHLVRLLESKNILH